ncbi:MAG: imidazoleglycerol-phosphate dehydratase HisB [Armatimonadetes bacterium]|nr:MAG: imidazoleglycerol-phosphate dehydratase HisB [Armatimonadota bacterium]
MTRSISLSRSTAEVQITGTLDLDGTGVASISTGLGFLDHMLGALTRHSGFDLELNVQGDIGVDDHHTVEDCAIVIGRGIDQLLGDRSGIDRFGSAFAPLDESLARVVVDCSGRGWPEISLALVRDTIGDVAAENLTHFFRSLAIEGRMALHVDVLRGDNDHHKSEAAFKATGLALKKAVAVNNDRIRSTKEVLG